MSETPKAKVMNTEILRFLNKQAIKNDYNRSLTERFFEDVDPDGYHVVVFNMLHNDGPEIRCLIFAKLKDRVEPVEIQLDIHIEHFLELPDHPTLKSLEEQFQVYNERIMS